MRSLEECKAEVLRRSDKRIKEHKKTRNRILACAIPLLGCLTVFSVATLLPHMLPVSEDQAPEENYMGSAGSQFCTYVAVDIYDAKDPSVPYRTITDTAEVAQIYGEILPFYVEDLEDGASGESTADKENSHSPFPESSATRGEKPPMENYQSGASGQPDTYILTFIAVDGEKDVYILSGNVLTKERTGEKRTLDAWQTENLKTVLALSE